MKNRFQTCPSFGHTAITTCIAAVLLLTSMVNYAITTDKMSHGFGEFSYLLRHDTLWAWGSNDRGQHGNGTLTSTNQPHITDFIPGVTKISNGSKFLLILKNDGTVWACGSNDNGQLGDGTTAGRTTLTRISDLSDIVDIATGFHHSLFLKSDGTVWACGANDNGQLGDGTTTERRLPQQVPGLTNIIKVTAGHYHSLFIKSNSTVWGCGLNNRGQLGLGHTTDIYTSVQLAPTNIIDIAAGYGHSLFLKSDNTVLSCGLNQGGSLGIGTVTPSQTPVTVTGLSGVIQISAGNYFSVFLKNDGTVWACGENYAGQLGDGTTISRSSPVQAVGTTNIASISTEVVHTMMLTNEGRLFVCGRNSVGQLGLGNYTAQVNPTEVTFAPLTTVSISPNVASVCSGNSVTLSSAALGGTWSTSATFASVSSSGVVTGLAAGLAVISYTNASGTGTATVTVLPRPNVSSVYNDGPFCTGQQILMGCSATGGTGALQYTWSGPGAFTSTLASPVVPSNFVPAGTYTATVTVKDANNCMATGGNTTVVQVNTGTTTFSGPSSVQVGSTIELVPSTPGGAWISLTTSVATVHNGFVTGASPGSAVIFYSAPAQCATTTTITVVSAPPPVVIMPSALTACAGSYFTLSTNGTGGSWSTAQTATIWVGSSGEVQPFADAPAGQAIITYTSPGGTATATITILPAPNVTSVASDEFYCVGQDVHLECTVSGGTGAYAYAWTGPGGFTSTEQSPTISGLAPGNYDIWVRVTDALNHCEGNGIVNTWVYVSGIPVVTGPASVNVGGTITLEPTEPGGEWISLNPGIATVDYGGVYYEGVVTGVAPGSAVIQYLMPGGCSATNTITVTEGAQSVCKGQGITLSNNGIPGGTWASANGSIATVGVATGIVTGVNAGTVAMFYFLPSGGGAFFTTTVTVKNLHSTTGNPGMCQGQSITLANTTGGYGSWSSADEEIAVVNAAGVVTGTGGGSVSIIYTAENGCQATKTITVTALPTITGVAPVCVGQGAVLTASGGGTWTSGNAAIATVNSTSGAMTGIGAGTVRISYISNGCAANVSVTVNPLSPITGSVTTACAGQQLVLANATPGTGSWLSSNTAIAAVTNGTVTGVSGGTVQISYTSAGGCVAVKTVTINGTAALAGPATVCAGQGISLSAGSAGGAWSSSSAAIATVNASGLVTGIGAGTTRISYTAGGCTVSRSVTVNALSATTATGGTTTCGGQQITLTNTTPGAGSWTSGNTSIAVVTGGIVTGVSGGTAQISYTSAAGCVAVKPVTINGTAGISGNTTVCAGQTTMLSSSIAGGTWASAADAIASVSSAGLVRGNGVGKVKIFYIQPSGCNTTVTVTVNALSQITGATAGMCASGNMTLANATPFGGVWTSSNTSAATVNPTTGYVKGVAAGSVTISFTATANGCVATKTIAINACRQGNGAVGENDYNSGITATDAIASELNVYPNPNRGQFTIAGSLAADNEEASIDVINMVGQVIYHNTVRTQNGSLNEAVQLQGNLPDGMYLLSVRTAGGSNAFRFAIRN